MPKVGYQNSSGWMTWVGARDTFMSNNAVSMLYSIEPDRKFMTTA